MITLHGGEHDGEIVKYCGGTHIQAAVQRSYGLIAQDFHIQNVHQEMDGRWVGDAYLVEERKVVDEDAQESE